MLWLSEKTKSDRPWKPLYEFSTFERNFQLCSRDGWTINSVRNQATEESTTWKVSVFGVILFRIFPYSDQNNSEYGQFLRSEEGAADHKNMEALH